MKETIYKLLYCSRNHLAGSLEQQAVEIRQILASARSNNARDGITGALIFSGKCFAQVLEGPLPAIEAVFEKIQRDARHGEVAVLESGFVPGRDFPEWSMAFAGTSLEESSAFAEFSFEQLISDPSSAAMQVHTLLQRLVVQEEEWEVA